MRYLPFTDGERKTMLTAVGVSDIAQLFADVPESARLDELAGFPDYMDELTVERRFKAFADQNIGADKAASFLGCGAYRHHIPATVDHLIQRSEFLTSYTPYQPEVSQGTLQYLFEFQSQVAQLTGCEIANASLYDGSTACAEAVLMAGRITKRHRAVLSGGLHPQYTDVVRTTTQFIPMDVEALVPDLENSEDLVAHLNDETACIVIQNPDFFGHLHDLRPLRAAAADLGVLVVAVVCEAVSLGAIMSPGEMGADIVVCEGQSFGNGLNFGGPYLGLMATRERFVRQMPGRLCGETVDSHGRRSYVLTLSTREQHIRREKATSNICTNSGLCALAFSIHLTLLGEAGLRRLAALNHAKAVQLAERLARIRGVRLLNSSFFNEFTLRLGKSATEVVKALVPKAVLAGVPVARFYPNRADLANDLIVAVTETNTDEEIEKFATALEEVLA